MPCPRRAPALLPLLFRNKTEKCSMYNTLPYFVPEFRTAYSPRHSAIGRAKRRGKKDRPRNDGNWRAVRGTKLIITAGGGGGSKILVLWSFKADSHIACRAHAVPVPLIYTCHAAKIYTCHVAPLPRSDSAVSFVKVRVVAGNIRTASPTV